MLVGRVGDRVRRLLPGLPVRKRPHGLQGHHSGTPCDQVARTGPALLTVGEAGRAPGGRRSGVGSWACGVIMAMPACRRSRRRRSHVGWPVCPHGCELSLDARPLLAGSSRSTPHPCVPAHLRGRVSNYGHPSLLAIPHAILGLPAWGRERAGPLPDRKLIHDGTRGVRRPRLLLLGPDLLAQRVVPISATCFASSHPAAPSAPRQCRPATPGCMSRSWTGTVSAKG